MKTVDFLFFPPLDAEVYKKHECIRPLYPKTAVQANKRMSAPN